MRESFTPRERTEEHERATLSAWARPAAETKGRDHHEEPDPLRTVFQQDRDRLAGSPELQRLAQVSAGLPVAGGRSLLARAHEVASTGRIIARSLGLNEDLVEAVALGRELGQPPFGRAGQVALAGIASAEFEPGEQALRVVEGRSEAGTDMNLTFETRDGILHHARPGAATVEGQLVAEVALFGSLSSDLDQALDAAIVQTADVPTAVRILGADHAARMQAVVADVAEVSAGPSSTLVSPALAAARDDLAAWTAERVDGHDTVLAAAERVVHCLRSLAVHLGARLESTEMVVDAICAMTDDGARRMFIEVFLPRPQGR